MRLLDVGSALMLDRCHPLVALLTWQCLVAFFTWIPELPVLSEMGSTDSLV